MNYDELKPGWELDAEVAEKVMGIDLTGARPDLPIRGIGCAPYSTDIAAAWEVWKHFFTGEQYTETLYRFTAHFQDPKDPDEPLYEIFQMIDPFEICIAALKATETQQ